MAKKELSELSVEELQKQHKTLKIATSTLGVLIFIMAGVCTYLTILQGFSVFTVLPIIFLSMILNNIVQMKKIKSEIASRN